MDPIIRVSGIHKSFLSGSERLKVLRGVDFSVSAGSFVSIVGHSGAGKSTLLHLMGALDHPDSGEIIFEGRNIFDGRPADIDRFRNREIGFVFQFHHLMPEFTALENVTMPALVARSGRDEAEAAAKRLLFEVGLSDRLSHRPGQLSGGEQQRVAVARALVMSPKILLADEPTGNLDEENSAAVFSLLKEFNSKRALTIVMVTHNRELASMTDRAFNLLAGVLEDYSP